MKKFVIVEKVSTYYTATIEAETLEEARELWENGDIEHWSHPSYGDDRELFEIEEI